MLKSIRNRKWVLAGAAALLWLLICLLVTPVYTTVTLTYAEDPSGEVITTVFAGPGENVSASDAKSRVVNSGVAMVYGEYDSQGNLIRQYAYECTMQGYRTFKYDYKGFWFQ